MRLFYSQTERPTDGAEYRNPRFFGEIEAGVEAVTVHGEWPEIVLAYVAAGVPVQIVGAETPSSPAPPAAPLPLARIPDRWRDLPWVGKAGGLTLRAVAEMVSGMRVINKAQAVAAIEAELARREASHES